MASNNVEIEIKIPLEENKFIEVREKLRKIAKFEKTSSQVDEYFTPAHKNFLAVEFPFEWLSVRKRSGKTTLHYKHYYPENAENHTHCDEFELEVKGPEQLEKMLSALGFKSLVTVCKERETYSYTDELEIALDSVKDLGYFTEIEALTHYGGVEDTRKKLFEFAKCLGIDAVKTDNRGYPFALMKKRGLIK